MPLQTLPKPPPKPRPISYGRTAPGSPLADLGDRMRRETGSALEQLLKHGSFTTGLEPLVKMAIAMEAPPGTNAWSRFQQVPETIGRGFSALGRGVRNALPKPGTLGLMGLGAAGALAYGVHRQNEHDRQNYPLVYAPMQGSYY